MAFETALASEIGEKPTAAQQGLALSATASFTAITRALRELRSAHGLKRRIQALIEALPALQSELRRTLKALGVVNDAGDGPNADSSQAINAQLSAIENEIHGDRHDQNS